MIAVVAALAAALCFAATSVMQHVAVGREAVSKAMSGKLIRSLVKRPLWLGSQVLDVVGVLLQATALRYGSVLLVQPLIAIGVVVAVPMRDIVGGHRPSGVVLLATGATCVGTAGLLIVLNPEAAQHEIGAGTAVPVYAVAFVLAGLLASAAYRLGPAARAVVLAAVAGGLMGAAGVALKPVVDALPHWGAIFTSWPVYAMVPCAAIGLVLSQSALQAARLPLPLTVLTVAEPVIAAIGGIWLLGERVGLHGIEYFLGTAALIVAIGGIAVIAWVDTKADAADAADKAALDGAAAAATVPAGPLGAVVLPVTPDPGPEPPLRPPTS